jgi:hypothetical protein
MHPVVLTSQMCRQVIKDIHVGFISGPLFGYNI